jgi:hypothetical protein
MSLRQRPKIQEMLPWPDAGSLRRRVAVGSVDGLARAETRLEQIELPILAAAAREVSLLMLHERGLDGAEER